ncbi:unnamed protein product [Candida verbasci]|uniref:Pet127-domain-containing protein n=1 Tax=Candida verbasci TaxID=1227364 RepID=A0A9W4TTY1_9ASCO|nr:unnamed protein product [Candida verbasci]
MIKRRIINQNGNILRSKVKGYCIQCNQIRPYTPKYVNDELYTEYLTKIAEAQEKNRNKPIANNDESTKYVEEPLKSHSLVQYKPSGKVKDPIESSEVINHGQKQPKDVESKKSSSKADKSIQAESELTPEQRELKYEAELKDMIEFFEKDQLSGSSKEITKDIFAAKVDSMFDRFPHLKQEHLDNSDSHKLTIPIPVTKLPKTKEEVIESKDKKQPKPIPTPKPKPKPTRKQKPKPKSESKKRIHEKVLETQEFVTSANIEHQPISQAIAPKPSEIPQLAHNLDRVLFSPGVHFLQDPRTRVYNFSPFLKNIIHYNDFNFEAISSFVPASKDDSLFENAQKFNKQFYSSTSSMTGMLTKFYLFLNDYDERNIPRFGIINFNGLSYKSQNSLIVEPKGKLFDDKTVYSIQADRSCDNETILSKMGHCMELLLTSPKEEFLKYSKDYEHDEKPGMIPNTYNYSSYGSFLMRSQLDCYDPRLPGNGTFDLKTRASINVRYNSNSPNISDNNYQICKLKGQYESYETEFNDLIRTGALLKYLFQARIGQMDGIYIAYHNIKSLFGFQYLPLSEIDKVFYNDEAHISIYNQIKQYEEKIEDLIDIEKLPSRIAESQFKFSIEIWENLLKSILIDLENEGYKDWAFRLITYTTGTSKNMKLRVHALPITSEEAEELQSLPDQFPASFTAAHLTLDEKRMNIKQHEDKLNEFNKKTTLNRPILSYDIEKVTSSIKKGQVVAGTLPKDVKSWQLRYKITRIENYPTQDYITLFSRSIEQLYKQIEEANQFDIKNRKKKNKVNKLRKDIETLEKLGELRLEIWKEKDDENQVYEPSEKL